MMNIGRSDYAVLRYGGASQARACAELGVKSGRASQLEAGFRRATAGGPDPMRPAFARHARHVAAVLKAGGYPELGR